MTNYKPSPLSEFFYISVRMIKIKKDEKYCILCYLWYILVYRVENTKLTN